MNLAIRGIDGNLGKEHADTFHNDLHPDLKADYVLANPPFNASDWRGDALTDDKRWQYGMPPASTPTSPGCSTSSTIWRRPGWRVSCWPTARCPPTSPARVKSARTIIEADLVDCMVALPGQLFYSTQIPVCLWFIARDKKNGRFRDRRGQTLFIDARKLGTMIDRVHRELTDDDIRKIADTYHAWRGDKECKASMRTCPASARAPRSKRSASTAHILTPGRYVGAEEVEDDGEPFEEKMARLTAALREQTEEGGSSTRSSGPTWRHWAMANKEQPDRKSFAALLADVKLRIQTAQTRAVLAANAELIRLYWDIGRMIDARQKLEGWGAGVIPRLAAELKNELPELKGFSERNIGLG
jgi:type I restriction enzyme M protein